MRDAFLRFLMRCEGICVIGNSGRQVVCGSILLATSKPSRPGPHPTFPFPFSYLFAPTTFDFHFVQHTTLAQLSHMLYHTRTFSRDTNTVTLPWALRFNFRFSSVLYLFLISPPISSNPPIPVAYLDDFFSCFHDF